jgi:predicted RNA binding protein YcfA (HicA-like mRNA interferase family)
MNSRAVIAALKADGWLQVARKAGRVTVPHPKRDLPAGTLRSIEKQAGLKLR